MLSKPKPRSGLLGNALAWVIQLTRYYAAKAEGAFDRATDRSAETEFLPAALEIIETPPSPIGRTLIKCIVFFFVIALLWACLGSVDIVATAPGKIVPTGRTKVIQPLEAGVVRAIRVQDGQQVKAGQVLVEIDSTINEAERDRLHKEFTTAELDVARLKAVLTSTGDSLRDFSPPKEASAAQIATQKSLMLNQMAEIHAKLTGLDRQIAQNKGNRGAVAATINKLTQSIPTENACEDA